MEFFADGPPVALEHHLIDFDYEDDDDDDDDGDYAYHNADRPGASSHRSSPSSPAWPPGPRCTRPHPFSPPTLLPFV